MSSVYNGVAANGARSPAVNPTIPADGDAGNAASINPALQRLADFIAWLQSHAAIFDQANTFTSPQVLQALTTITDNLWFSAGVLQSILKGGGGKLQIGTSIAQDLELLWNGVVIAAISTIGASVGLDMKANRIANLGAPSAATDAATKGYVDGKFPAISWTAPTVGTGFTSGAGGFALGFMRDSFGFVHYKGQATCTSGAGPTDIIAQTPPPAGMKPVANRYLQVVDVTAGTIVPAFVSSAYGHIQLLSGAVNGHVYDISGIQFAGEV